MVSNPIDSAWNTYREHGLRDELTALYTSLEANPNSAALGATSEHFGSMALRSLVEFQRFFRRQADWDQSLGAVSYPSRAALAVTARLVQAAIGRRMLGAGQLLEHDQLDLLREHSLLPTNLARWLTVVNSTSSEKLSRLIEQDLPDTATDQPSRLCGSEFHDGIFTRVEFSTARALLISVTSPIDALYFPSSGVLLQDSKCRFDIGSRLAKYFHNLFASQKYSASAWTPLTGPRSPIQLIWDKRPYHVVADELSGYFSSCARSGISHPLVFLDRASFVESGPFGATVRTPAEVQEDGLDAVFYTFHDRLVHRSPWCADFRKELVRRATSTYGSLLPERKPGQKCFWLGISGAEKRAWLEERTALTQIATWLNTAFPDAHFVFDGWTGPHNPSRNDIQQCEYHEAMLAHILASSRIDRSRVHCTIGAPVLKKVAFASYCDFFVSCAGTPAFWPSNICKVPGVVHNSTQMINQVDKTLFTDNLTKVPTTMISDIAPEGAHRYDFVNYSIPAEPFLDLCKEALERALGT